MIQPLDDIADSISEITVKLDDSSLYIKKSTGEEVVYYDATDSAVTDENIKGDIDSKIEETMGDFILSIIDAISGNQFSFLNGKINIKIVFSGYTEGSITADLKLKNLEINGSKYAVVGKVDFIDPEKYSVVATGYTTGKIRDHKVALIIEPSADSTHGKIYVDNIEIYRK